MTMTNDMADEVLSQAEVESLLTAMESQPAGGRRLRGPDARRAACPAAAPGSREKVTPYDFKRPERVGKEQMRALQSLHEGFGRNFGAALSALLRTIVEVKLTSVDQLTYSEFVFSLENPTCFNLLKAEPLEGQPDPRHQPVDPLPDHRPPAGRRQRRRPRLAAAADGDRAAAGRRGSPACSSQELKHAWEGVLPLKLSVDRVESNPQLVQIVPPNEVVVLISFELTLGELRGMMNLCIPVQRHRADQQQAGVQQLGHATASRAPRRVAGGPRPAARRGRRSRWWSTLAETQITTADLIGLRVGDIITTDKDVHQALDVAVQGAPNSTPRRGLQRPQGHPAIPYLSHLLVPVGLALGR